MAEAEKVYSIQDAAELASRAKPRAVYWYDVPEEIAKATGVKTVGLVELKANEELMASQRAAIAGNVISAQMKLAWELPKEALRFANDDQLSTADGSADTFWGRDLPMMSQLRQLIISAYQNIHATNEKDTKSFC